MGLATTVQRDASGNWQGVDGGLHPEDATVLDLAETAGKREALTNVNGILADLMGRPVPPRPQNFAAFMQNLAEAKEQVRTIRAATALRDELQRSIGDEQ